MNDWTPDRTPALWGRTGKVDAVFANDQDKVDLQAAHEEVVNAPHEV